MICALELLLPPDCSAWARDENGRDRRSTCEHRGVKEVRIDAIPLNRLASLLDGTRAARLAENTERARLLLAGRTVWNVNATATGGGVAEMLQALLAYCRGAQIEARWLVLDGTPEFFQFTKRLHNHLHGSDGDGGRVNDGERLVYEDILADNLEYLRSFVRPGDMVLLHDPQTAGLASGLRDVGAHVMWRCHVGRDQDNVYTEAAWDFLRPYLEDVEALIFSRREYAPDWVRRDRLWVIPPSLDPFSAKNEDLARSDLEATLRHAGLVEFPENHGEPGVRSA